MASIKRKAHRVGLWVWLFGVAMAIGGFAWLMLGFVQPLKQVRQAKTWNVAECAIERAEVRESTDSDGDTDYHIDVGYQFVHEGKRYTGTRYSFFDSYYSRKRTISTLMNELRAERVVPCYFDPLAPERNVINREWDRTSMFSIGSIALILIGVIMCVYAARQERRVVDGLPGIERWHKARGRDGTLKLRPRASPFIKILLTLAMVAIAVPLPLAMWYAFPGWAEARFMVRLGLGIPAVAALAYFVYVTLELIGPRIRIRLPTLQLRPGDTVDLGWSARSVSPAIRSLRFTLEGRQEAMRVNGDQTDKKQHTFQTIELKKLAEPKHLRHRKVPLELPDTLMPSFESEHNKIYWVVRIHADVAFWPDVNEEFELIILPKDARS